MLKAWQICMLGMAVTPVEQDHEEEIELPPILPSEGSVWADGEDRIDALSVEMSQPEERVEVVDEIVDGAAGETAEEVLPPPHPLGARLKQLTRPPPIGVHNPADFPVVNIVGYHCSHNRTISNEADLVGVVSKPILRCIFVHVGESPTN